MIEFTVGGVKIRVGFLFFAVLTALMLIDRTGLVLWGLAACMIHESGHLLACLLVGHRPKELTLEPTGIRMVEGDELISYHKEICILLAGSLTNLLTCSIIFLSLQTVGARLFATTHLVLGVFNLLPIGALDGGRIVRLTALNFLPPDRAERVSELVSILFLIPIALLSIVLVLSASRNFTLLITCVYLILMLVLKNGR